MKNGEPISSGLWISDADKDYFEFEAKQIYFLMDQDFAEICIRRKKQKMIGFY